MGGRGERMGGTTLAARDYLVAGFPVLLKVFLLITSPGCSKGTWMHFI